MSRKPIIGACELESGILRGLVRQRRYKQASEFGGNGATRGDSAKPVEKLTLVPNSCPALHQDCWKQND